MTEATYALTKAGMQISVVTPYNPQFNTAIKSDLGARWSAGAWQFDARDEEELLKVLRRFHGWAPGMALASARVFVDEEQSCWQSPLVLLGRALVTATGRDSGARLGDGVRLRKGNVGSGGSMKNWTTVIDADTELIVHDVPIEMVRDYVAGRRKRDDVRVELIVPAADLALDAVALNAEREQLSLRIAEIDALLATSERLAA